MSACRLTVFAGPHDVLHCEPVDSAEVWTPQVLGALSSARLSPLGEVPLALLHQGEQLVGIYLGRTMVPERARRLGRVPPGLRWLTGQLTLPLWGVPLRCWVGPDLACFQHLLDPTRAWLLPYLLELSEDLSVETVEASDGSLQRFWLGPQLYAFDGHDRRGPRLYSAGATPRPRLEHADAAPNDRLGRLLSWGAIRL